MKTATGTIKMEATLLCPHCECSIDLLNQESLNDDDQLKRLIAEDDGEDWATYQELLNCPDCFKSIQIKGLTY
jgi:hypothetical protein